MECVLVILSKPLNMTASADGDGICHVSWQYDSRAEQDLLKDVGILNEVQIKKKEEGDDHWIVCRYAVVSHR